MATTTGRATDFITFSRASLGTVTGSDGKVKWAGHNRLLASEQFGATQWGVTGGVTITSNSTAAPNGTTTADTLAYTTTGYHYQTVVIGHSVSGLTFSAGVWLWTTTGKATIVLRLCGQTTGTDQTTQVVTLTSTPTLYTVSRTFTSTDTTIQVGIDNRTGNGGDGIAGNVIAWGAHLYRSDLGGMVLNPARGDAYYPTTPKNLLGYTEDFSNAAWSTSAASVVANLAVSPNGLQTADKLVEGTTNAGHVIFTTYSSSASPYTFSVYAKAAERNWIFLRAGINIGSYFNLTSGVVGTVDAGVSASIVSVGNGWYRCSITLNGSAGTNYPTIFTATGNGTNSYTGDGTSGVYLWGAQLSDSASLDAYSANAFAAPTAAAYHAPRLDYDPSTLAAKGLLVEEQRTNLLLRSAEFDSASVWLIDAATVSANSVAAPDGTTTADKLTESTAAGTHDIYQACTSLAAGTYTYSVYVKPAGRTKFRLMQTLTTSYGVLFDLTALTATSVIGGATGVITSVGNGFYRCSMTYTTVATFTQALVVFLADATGNVAYTGDGTSGIYLWGAQLEAGSFATSYIPTTSASVTRSADVAQVATSAFPYSASEGTLVLNWDQLSASAGVPLVSALSSGTSSNYIGCLSNPSSFLYAVADGGVSQVSLTTGTVAANTAAKGGIVYKANDFAVSFNGGAVVTDTSGTVPAVSQMNIGSLNSGNFLNGHIRQITYIPRRLTNAELQARTA